MTLTLSQTASENERREYDTFREIIGIARDLAMVLANDPGQVSVKSNRTDIVGFEVENSITPGLIEAKRGTETPENRWTRYVWNRIHVTVSRGSISTGRLIRKAREYGFTVVDVWQFEGDLQANLGQQDLPAIRFALERVD